MENNFKFIVYQTINLANNKIYVGYHKTKNPDIFDGYIGNGVNINYPSTYMNPKWPFQMAVKKYGISNFKRITLFIFNTKEEALLKEFEIVNKDFINRSDTYNLVEGGYLHPIEYSSKKVYQYDATGTLLKIWDDCDDAAAFLEICKNSIYSAISSKRRLHSYYWSFDDVIDISTYTSPNIPTKTYKYNTDGKCVAIYESMYLAAKENGCKVCTISNAIKLHSLTHGYYYSNILYDTYIPKNRLNLRNTPIYCYDSNTGNFIMEVENQKLLKRYQE